MQLKFSRQIFEKYSIIKIYSTSVQSEPSCFMRTDGWTDRRTDEKAQMTKPTVAFRSFANAYKNQH